MASFSLSQSGLGKLLTGSAWLAVSAVLGQGSMLVAGVLVARVLGVQDYGRFTLMQATLMLLAGVAQLSFAVVIAQQVAKYRDRDPEAASRVAAFCLLFTLTTSALLAVLLAILNGILARDVFRDPPLSAAILAVAAILPMVGVAGVQQGLFNGLGRFRAQAWISLALAPLVIAAPFYGAREYGLLGALGGLACTFAGRSIVAQAVLLRVFRQEGLSWTFTIARKQAARLLNLAGPATLAGIAVSLAVWGGQTLLARQDGGNAALGLFNASYMLRAVIIFLPQQLVLALLPMVTRGSTSAAAKQRLLRFSVGAVLLFSTAAATTAALLATPLLSLFGPGFAAGRATLVWLLLSAPLEALTMTLYQILQSEGRFWRGFLWVNAPLAGTVLGAGAILVPEELSEGLAMAWLSGWAIALVLTMAAVRATKVGTLTLPDTGFGPSLGLGPARLSSTIALSLARVLPRGHWRVASWAARRDPALWDFTLPLVSPAGEHIRVDMRETVASNFLRHGLIPGQRGHEKLLRKVLRHGDLCFDVGANIGYTAILFASLVRPGGRVVALEPGDRVFPILERNAHDRTNVTARKLGASDKTGVLTFYESAMSDVSSVRPISDARRITIDTVSLDSLAEEEGHPQFIKIDVEGHEPAVFAGMTKLLRHAKPPIVLFEALTDAVLAECERIVTETGSGMVFYAVARDGSLSPQLGLRETADFLALPRWANQRLD